MVIKSKDFLGEIRPSVGFIKSNMDIPGGLQDTDEIEVITFDENEGDPNNGGCLFTTIIIHRDLDLSLDENKQFLIQKCKNSLEKSNRSLFAHLKQDERYRKDGVWRLCVKHGVLAPPSQIKGATSCLTVIITLERITVDGEVVHTFGKLFKPVHLKVVDKNTYKIISDIRTEIILKYEDGQIKIK